MQLKFAHENLCVLYTAYDDSWWKVNMQIDPPRLLSFESSKPIVWIML